MRTLAALVAGATILMAPIRAWPQPSSALRDGGTSSSHRDSGLVTSQYERPEDRRYREQQENLRREEQERDRKGQQEDIERRSRWGALAYSRASNKWGFASNHYFEEMARRGALSACGSSDCEVVTFFDSCAGVAIGDEPAKNDWYDGKGDTIEDAEENAIDACRQEGEGNCRVVVSRCSPE